mgnify:CR=1 FL=1
MHQVWGAPPNFCVSSCTWSSKPLSESPTPSAMPRGVECWTQTVVLPFCLLGCSQSLRKIVRALAACQIPLIVILSTRSLVSTNYVSLSDLMMAVAGEGLTEKAPRHADHNR